jgi:DNA-binding transcriptional MerR regulator
MVKVSETEGGESAQMYRIGAVSRLTGVPPDTLRVWERRYKVVTPFRSGAGTRLYGPEDVGRLALIKQLVDRGDAISRVARLSVQQLRERLRGDGLALVAQAPRRPCRVVVLGRGLSERVKQSGLELEGIDYVGRFEERNRFRQEAASLSPDVAVLEIPTVHPDQVHEVADLVADSGAAHALVVYNFAAAAALERLQSRRILPRRAPLDPGELRRWCLVVYNSDAVETAGYLPEDPGGLLAEPIPPRRFDQLSLARIAAASPTVRCECPHHLVDLITSLAAFETYSEECEIRHAEDAALHAFLHHASAQARSLMEAALARVVEAEGISLSGEA